MAFGGFATALGLAEDLKKGLIDRFRSLPMSRSAVLTGRTLADVAHEHRSQLVVMLGVGCSSASTSRRARRRGRRNPAPAPDRLRVLVGLRLRRPRRLVARGGERATASRPLPGHVRLVGVRAGASRCRAGCSRSPRTTRSRSWSTPSGRCSSASRPATSLAGRALVRSGSPLVFGRRSPSGAYWGRREVAHERTRRAAVPRARCP